MTQRAGHSRHVPLAMLLGAALGAAAGASCGERDDDFRRGVLHHVAHALGEPTFADLQLAAHDVETLLDVLCQAPTVAALDAARAAWADERAAWVATLPFTYGPVAEQMQKGALDFWPARADTIEAAIATAASAAAIDDAFIDGKGTSAKGIPALEYLLFGDDPAAVLPALTDPATGARRCAYARALATDIAGRSDDLAAAWTPTFADQLASAGDGSALYRTAQLGVDEVVNNLIEALGTMVKVKLDDPLGNTTGAAADPALLESRFSGRGKADLLRSLAAAWAVYHGADLEGPSAGVAVLVHDLDPGLHQRVTLQYEHARDAVDAIPEPMSAALVDDRSAVQFARDELDTLRRMMKLDVASTLGVTLALTDNDGD